MKKTTKYDKERQAYEVRTDPIIAKLAAHLKTSAEVKAILAELESSDGFYIDIGRHHYAARPDGVAYEGWELEPGSSPEQAAEYERVRKMSDAEWDAMMAGPLH